MQEMKTNEELVGGKKIAGHGETYRHDIDIGGVCIEFGFRQKERKQEIVNVRLTEG